MKKILCSFLILGACLTSNTFAAVKCDSLRNTTWRGDLGEVTNVDFHINYDNNGNGTLSGVVNFNFDNGSGSAELDMLEGSCKENSDGTTTISLSRDSYGVKGNITAIATNSDELNISSFTYQDPWGSNSGKGRLKKS